MRTHHHDPDEEESVGGQQPHDGHLVGVEVDVVLSHEGAGEDGLQSVVESEVRMTEKGLGSHQTTSTSMSRTVPRNCFASSLMP